MFSRIAVINRGEPAVRLIRAVRELNAEFGYGIKVIALHTESERGALFVRLADEGVRIREKGELSSPYLDHAVLRKALIESKADAAWVGWGFVAEDPTFAELCEELGVTFIGPPPEAMRRLGDKVEAKYMAEATNVPVAPWSGGPVETMEEALEHAKSIGYPMILKARSGGGGRGIRMVFDPAELEEAIERTQSEAQKAFNDHVIFMEHLVQGGRHIEVQVIADNYGNAWAPGVRDCSIQRRNQKLIEESFSPALTKEQAADLAARAIDLVLAVGYRGAGTVEFLYQPEKKTFAFLEVNTRLQVEHPITEASTGIDLVKLQILVADGYKLEGDCPPVFGHSVEARLNAEDADNGFAPSPGKVELLTLPVGPGIRVDTGIATGDAISPDYDSMVAKIIAWGRDRDEALARLRVALRETTVVVKGGTTTKSFLLKLLDRPEVIDGTADTGWLDRANLHEDPELAAGADVALLYVAADVYESEEQLERDAFLRSAHGGRPKASHEVGREIELGYRGQTYSLNIAQISPRRYRVEVPGGGVVELELERQSKFESRLSIGDRRHQIVAATNAAGHLVEVDSVSHRVSRDEGGMVRSPAPAVVVALRAAPGDDVQAGDTIMILEAMKMETAVKAPYAGRVREILASVNSQVDAGGALLRLDKIEEEGAASTAPVVEFSADSVVDRSDLRVKALRDLRALRALVMGYDVSAQRAKSLWSEYDQVREQVPLDDDELLGAALDVMETFADLAELSRNRPAGEEESGDEQVHSPREYFHSYLQSLDLEVAGLPEGFRSRLAKALAHYGVTDLEPSPALEEAVYRVFLAQERVGDQIPIIAGLLERWRTRASLLSEEMRQRVGAVVERLVVATRSRYPLIGDLARSIRFEVYERPVIEAARTSLYEEVRADVGVLAENPGAPNRAELMDTLVASSEPVVRLMAEELLGRPSGVPAMLEVMNRRYYKIRDLEDVEVTEIDGRPSLTGNYELGGNRLYLISTTATHADLPAALSAADAAANLVPDPANLVTDLYVAWADAPEDPDAISAELARTLQDYGTIAGGRRVTVTVAFNEAAPDVLQFTFRPGSHGLAEERVIRGMHPLTGQRLDLWRLKNFNGTRVPAAEGTYVFHLVAPNNPADERLVALAEVRDVTPVRDADGHVVSFPAAERVLAACLESIRRAQAGLSGRKSLQNNAIFLHVWPPVEVPVSDLGRFAQDTAPLTLGTGLSEITVLARLRQQDGSLKDVALRFAFQAGAGVQVTVSDPPTEPLAVLDDYALKVQRSAARGAAYPYEIIPLLTGANGQFTEYDFRDDNTFGPVDRGPGQNKAGVIVGVVTTPSERYPEGMTRVLMMGDPTKALGTVAVAECNLIAEAVKMAGEKDLPVEWFTLSSGAKISMDSGTENMDGVAKALREIVLFTQNGGEINIIVSGINVGAQPYWNAEATMLMHTKGILIMTPDSAMVLTGKLSLDYSGGVSAEDNFGIGGYDRVMGPNGEAQYWAPNLSGAVDILFQHYEHAYHAPGEKYPRRAATSDPLDRDVRSAPHVHPDSPFTTVGEIFAEETNKDRKKPFDIRAVINAIADQDHATLERWAGMAEADTAVVVDAHLGGYPVAILGIESRAIPRRGFLPSDGPDSFSGGTLFPKSSKKAARAINSASGSRPLVVLANLSGFDGSPESLRNIQLEYGAEIGRAIVNFDGPIIFCVISRYHGGAFVVFSGALNDNMEVIAIEGSYASVIGGAPAAAVVFTRDVNNRTANDARVTELEARIADATDDAERSQLRVELAETRAAVRSEKLGEVAVEFEQIHNIERAREVGSVHTIIPAVDMRPYLIEAVERGMARTGG
ncbi:ATP-binding protein [Nakamurella multipartita]|uniref:Carbamoyl-phosphate synthase L chain ATP-binding n=1 Tax=Nakamurella multipartita (strain ATCC 700099 / DSM 44233 / CIP 104796 / JCM 9543 / NBRC 105858 / Y-104) TaxID=479431 RepID=C8XJ83_NAKMY|nr:carboxyl transferase domain-containing protein [Nakamurella multipartita]ACV78548.1 Carbamoyl-phosphate synthase L chain ATP- binding [Nakamurella multipartita DSM 44233]